MLRTTARPEIAPLAEAELVDEHLDLSRIRSGYSEGRGAPPYDPRLMVRVLIYGYTTGHLSHTLHIPLAIQTTLAVVVTTWNGVVRVIRPRSAGVATERTGSAVTDHSGDSAARRT